MSLKIAQRKLWTSKKQPKAWRPQKLRRATSKTMGNALTCIFPFASQEQLGTTRNPLRGVSLQGEKASRRTPRASLLWTRAGIAPQVSHSLQQCCSRLVERPASLTPCLLPHAGAITWGDACLQLPLCPTLRDQATTAPQTGAASGLRPTHWISGCSSELSL